MSSTHRHRSSLRALSFAAIPLFAAIGLGGLSGCRSAPETSPYARIYPFETPRAPKTLDIQVIRAVRTIEFTNSSGKAFGPCTIWLNRRFSLPIDGLAIGQRVELRLSDFVDEFSDPFRAGGFFAADAPDVIVMAEIEYPSPTMNPAAPDVPQATAHPADLPKGSELYSMIVVKGTV